MTNQVTKTFAEINGINVNKYVEKKGKFSYLSWAYAWAEVKKEDASATFEVHKNEKKMPFFFDKDFPELGAFVEVSITFNGLTLSETHPIIDNFNKTIPLSKLNAFTINTSVKRCLAKAAALHGFGLYIYAGEDLPESVETEPKAEVKPVATNNVQNLETKKAAEEVTKEKIIVPTKPTEKEFITKLINLSQQVGEGPVEENGDWAYAPVLKEETGPKGIYDPCNAAILKEIQAFNKVAPNQFIWNAVIKNYVLTSKYDYMGGYFNSCQLDRLTRQEYVESLTA